MQKIFIRSAAALLQHAGLLIAFMLFVAARDFAVARPGLSAGLVFLFSWAYLLAAVTTRRAPFLYGFMLLGAASYFLTCYALGAPGTSFPLLSVPLVTILWFVRQYLHKRLPADLEAFPLTVFRAANITIAIFTAWALSQAPGLIGSASPQGYIAGATFLGYAALYLAHCVFGAGLLYSYLCAGYLLLGGMLLAAWLWSGAFAWLPAVATGAVLVFVAARLRRLRSFAYSRHFYYAAGTALAVSLTSAALEWPYFAYALALSAATLWFGYQWLAAAVGDVRQATVAERAMAKWLTYGAVALVLPIAGLAFVLLDDPHVVAASLVAGSLLAWIGWQRRAGQSESRNYYLLLGIVLLAAAVLGLPASMPLGIAIAWSIVAPIFLLALVGLLHVRFGAQGYAASQRSLAEGVSAVAFFAWYAPLVAQGAPIACVGAAVALAGVIVLARIVREPAILTACGPAAAGLLVALSCSVLEGTVAAWSVCVAGSLAAGAAFVWADSGGRTVARGTAFLAWFVLSVAAVALVAPSGVGHSLCCITTLGAAAVLMEGWRASRAGGGAQDRLLSVVAYLSTVAVVALGPFCGWGATSAGSFLLILAAANAGAWGLAHRVRHAHAAVVLYAVGVLLVIFGSLPSLEAQLVAGAAAVALLFLLGQGMCARYPAVGVACVLVGHAASMALASEMLAVGWLSVGSGVALAIIPHVLLYALMPGLRGNPGFKVGALGWFTLLVLVAVSAHMGTPYHVQAPLLAGLALVWLGLGYALRRGPLASWSVPLYTAAGLVAGFSGLVGLFAPSAQVAWPVFLMCGLVYTALFALFRQDAFAYLVTLSFALLAYSWVRESTSRFTQDLMFYLVVAIAALGTLYLLPYIRHLLGRMGALPLFAIFTWRGAALTAVPIACGAFVVFSAYSVKMTEHPKFCVACHNMGDYYDSWQHSSHQDVACVQCHYEPGLEAKVEGKMAGMIQLVKYISHAYGNKPHALISNRSCTREGCHTDIYSNKETVLFHGKVKFSHARHLNDHPRGKELNCVSCHGQMVEGQHISVAETTCLTCHFYGRGAKPVATGECQTCHTIPQKTVEYQGQEFNHQEFLKGKKNVRCEHCHSQITQGDGAVSKTRCQSCHLGRIPKLDDQEKFHLTHVSEGHFDCLQCHDEIRHGQGLKPHQMMASTRCGTCHGSDRHSIQELVYAGRAVADLEPEPDVMFKAGVACDGCHIEKKVVTVGSGHYESRGSTAKQCAGCHDDSDYGDMLAEWQTETRDRLKALEPQLAALDQAGKAANGSQEQIAKLLEAARGRVACIQRDGSFGAHNYVYVSSLLDRAEEEAKKGLALAQGQKSQGSGE